MIDYRLSEGTPALKRINIPMDDVKEEQVYSLEDMLLGDQAGTTDTDQETHGVKGAGYTTIYRKYT